MLRKCLVLLGLAALTLIFSNTPVQAQNRPIQLAVITPLQLFPEDNPISGVRLNLIYGRNVSVKGLDLGLINHTTTGHSKGVQWGFVSVVDSDFTGWQDNWVSVTKGRFKGFQSGFVNYANDMHGFQFGLVNYAETMYGLQVGLINIIKQGGAFPVFPLVNWSF